MSELEDFSLDPDSTDGGGQGWGGESNRSRWIIALVVVAVVVGGGWWLWCQPEKVVEEPAPEPAVQAETDSDEDVPDAPEVEVPSLDESDPWLREVVAQLSARPELARWLATDDLVRRFVAAVDNAASGESPRVHIPFLAPDGPFIAVDQRGSAVVDEASWRRYNTAASVVSSLHTQGTGELFKNLMPVFDEAYRDLGYPEGGFDRVALRAIRQILSVRAPEGPVRLVPEGVSTWAYASSSLESLPPFQKQLLRMGPENLRRVQTKVREIALAAGYTAAELDG